MTARGMGWFLRMVGAVLVLAAVPAAAQVVQSPDDALRQDAATLALRWGVAPEVAEQRLRAQAETASYTDALRGRFADRLAGIAIEHAPGFRIVVLLTGDAPVADEHLLAAGIDVPVVFRTGAAATEAEVVAAIGRDQAAIRAALTRPPGIGFDPRTGAMVVLVQRTDADLFGATELRDAFAELTGVPVEVRVFDRDLLASGVEGGGRVVGLNPADGHRYVCTTGFVVTDGQRSGVVTAAHCPDQLEWRGTEAAPPLRFVGQWGWGSQDVQVHAAPGPLQPTFLADSARSVSRPVTAARTRTSLRAGEALCHRGERTGYSCAEVGLTDFAPAGDLCGGPCLPTWVTVAGPTCRSGDSGGPVFAGTTAFGIVKGASYAPDGTCRFYFFMPLDFLPAGWSLALSPGEQQLSHLVR
jgi:streptogrisin C